MINALNKIEIEKMAVSELMGLTDLLSIQSLIYIYPPSYGPSPPCLPAGRQGERDIVFLI